jgi:hypothetical protein
MEVDNDKTAWALFRRHGDGARAAQASDRIRELDEEGRTRMATTTVVDQYVVELERPGELDSSLYPIRAMATNTADASKTAETWLSLDGTRASLIAVMGAGPEIVDWYLQQLEDQRYVQLEASVPGVKVARAIFNSRELVRIGFEPDDLEM